MANLEKVLQDAWNSIEYYDGGSLQLGVSHPLEWHVSYVTPKSKALVIVTKYAVKDIVSSKCIVASCTKRQDGRYCISFRLTDMKQQDVFIAMCENLIAYSAKALSEKTSVDMVMRRYQQWRRLMEKSSHETRSDAARRGLIGELLYLKKMIDELKNPSRAVGGWVGPDGADQDFVYESIWREIKSTGVASDIVTIHSVEQLGDKDNSGLLLIFRVDPCAPEAEGAFTLSELVDEVRESIGADFDTVDSFCTKIAKVGYSANDEYERYHYQYSGFAVYDVNSSFPRLTRDDVAVQITNCEYSISIPTIEEWKRG